MHNFYFIVGIIVFFIILIGYVLARSQWTYNEKRKLFNNKNVEFVNLVSHDKILWSFWIWNIEKFIDRRFNV